MSVAARINGRSQNIAACFLLGVGIDMPLELPKGFPPGIKGEEIAKSCEYSECHATESRVHGAATMNGGSAGMEIPRAWNKRDPIEQQGHARDSQGPEQVLTNT
jgi:hypothetical protein